MKKILLSVVLMTAAFALFGQSSMFDVARNTYDPYIAEKDGFESLFVNPAGMAGQTNIFTWDIDAGTAGATKTYETLGFLIDNQEMLFGETTGTPGELDPANVEQMMDLIVDTLETNGDLDALTTGTSLSGWTADQIVIYFEGGGELSQTDADQIQTNIEGNPAIIEDAFNALTQDLKVKVEASTKLGTLINGFGIGVYGSAYTILDASVMGFDTIVGESGLKLGYGWNWGPLGLGVSGDFSSIGRMADVTLENLYTHDVVYGYAWGIDVGATFDILPSLTVGAVMTDIIGSYADAGLTTLDALSAGAEPSVTYGYEYSFDLDMDFGITWAPKIGNGKLIAPKLHMDYYDFFGVFREETRPQDFQGFLNHVRLGAELELLSFINAKAQYYREFFTLGAGVDLLFLEVFGEFMFDQAFEEIGGAMLVKLHF